MSEENSRTVVSEPQTIVVVGGGQAGFSFLERARRNFPKARLVLVGDEPDLPYQRPPLSKKYMTGDMPRESLLFRGQDWYDDNKVECHLGVELRAIDRETRTLKLSNSNTLDYDRLMLATGSSARTLPLSLGGGLKNVFEMRSLRDADALEPHVQDGKHLVVIGGGYIGLEAAAVAASAGMTVTVIEMSDRILQRVASAETSDYFRSLHQQKGVTVLESAGLQRLEEGDDGTVCAAVLSDGQKLAADAVLVGIGIIPNDDLAARAGLEVNNGIVGNSRAQTSDPDIYAAGDCARFVWNGDSIRLESVQNAIEQAQNAADHIANIGEDYAPMPWFWSDQYDVKLQIAGLNAGHTHVVVRPGSREGAQSVWYFYGDTFIAVDAMNEPRAYLAG